jgi:hypothetical protein
VDDDVDEPLAESRTASCWPTPKTRTPWARAARWRWTTSWTTRWRSSVEEPEEPVPVEEAVDEGDEAESSGRRRRPSTRSSGCCCSELEPDGVDEPEAVLDPDAELLAELVDVEDDEELAVEDDEGEPLTVGVAELVGDAEDEPLKELELEEVLEDDGELEDVEVELDEPDADEEDELLGVEEPLGELEAEGEALDVDEPLDVEDDVDELLDDADCELLEDAEEEEVGGRSAHRGRRARRRASRGSRGSCARVRGGDTR